MGESFLHGLDLVNSLEGKNLKLQQALTSAKTFSDYYKGMLDGAEKKIEEVSEAHKAELKRLQDELEKANGIETHAQELAHLRTEKESLQQGKDVELSNAFSLGFKLTLKTSLLPIQITTGRYASLIAPLPIW